LSDGGEQGRNATTAEKLRGIKIWVPTPHRTTSDHIGSHLTKSD